MLTKKESLQMKGAAILIMIFLHLFINPSNVALCQNYFFWRGEPVVSQLAKFTGICVSLYLFLSGYGLYIIYRRNSNIRPWKRILKLYLNFWIVFVIFIPLAAYLYPDRYPGNWMVFLNNVTGWHTTYNGEWWFLFPYILLLLSAKWIFRVINNLNFMQLVLLVGGIFIVSYLGIWLNRPYLYSHQLAYMPILYVNTLSSFAIGAIFVKYDISEQLRKKIPIHSIYSNLLIILIFIFLLFVRAISPVNIVNIIYLVLFVSWFIIIKKARWISWCLERLGEQSTNMWLVHTFFCYYLFHDWIYSFRYPIVIYAVTILISYFTGCLIDKINLPLQKYVIGKLWKTIK